jgi:NADH dehydrogenase FAD-containing subunit
MKIVILGGGFGGVYTLKYLHKLFHCSDKTRTIHGQNGQLINKINILSEQSVLSPKKFAVDVKFVLVNKKNYFLFTPLLHEFATGSVSLENLVEPIRGIIRCCDYEFIHGEVKRIDLEKKIVYVDTQTLQTSRGLGGKNKNADFAQKEKNDISAESAFHSAKSAIISYDYLVIALGAKTNFYNIPGAEENSFTLKSLDKAIRLRNHFIHMFEKYANDIYPNKNRMDFPNKEPNNNIYPNDNRIECPNRRLNDELFGENSGNLFGQNSVSKFGPNLGNNLHSSAELTFVIVGGGATGVELAAEMSDYFYKTFSKFYPKEIISKVKIILIEKENELTPQFSPKLRKIALEVLKKKNIEVILEKGVKEVGKDFIKLDDETIIKTKTVIWTAGVKPNLPEIIGNVEKDSKGRLIANEYLQVKNYDNVFSIGDVCCFIQNQKPLPQLAQVAVRQAKTVAKNILNLIKNKPLEKFVYRHQGDLISLGRFFAIGEIKNFTFSGFFAWILWRVVYLYKLISNKDKVKTFTDWLLDFFYPRDITEI